MSDELVKAEDTEAGIQEFPNGWKLITAGTWQISVGPDGLLMLPRLLRPEDVSHFVKAATVAAEVGAAVRTANEDRAQSDNRASASRRAIVRPSPASGGARANVTQANPAKVFTGMEQTPRGSIGRRRASHRGGQVAGSTGVPQRPRVPQPPRLPNRGQ